MKFATGFLTALLVVQPQVETVERTQLVVRGVPMETPDAGPVPTPILDSLIDWEEQDRQSLCLYEFMLESGLEFTLESVWAAGDLTDALGGACLVIGEDDE